MAGSKFASAHNNGLTGGRRRIGATRRVSRKGRKSSARRTKRVGRKVRGSRRRSRRSRRGGAPSSFAAASN